MNDLTISILKRILTYPAYWKNDDTPRMSEIQNVINDNYELFFIDTVYEPYLDRFMQIYSAITKGTEFWGNHFSVDDNENISFGCDCNEIDHEWLYYEMIDHYFQTYWWPIHELEYAAEQITVEDVSAMNIRPKLVQDKITVKYKGHNQVISVQESMF